MKNNLHSEENMLKNRVSKKFKYKPYISFKITTNLDSKIVECFKISYVSLLLIGKNLALAKSIFISNRESDFYFTYRTLNNKFVELDFGESEEELNLLRNHEFSSNQALENPHVKNLDKNTRKNRNLKKSMQPITALWRRLPVLERTKTNSTFAGSCISLRKFLEVVDGKITSSWG